MSVDLVVQYKQALSSLLARRQQGPLPTGEEIVLEQKRSNLWERLSEDGKLELTQWVRCLDGCDTQLRRECDKP